MAAGCGLGRTVRGIGLGTRALARPDDGLWLPMGHETHDDVSTQGANSKHLVQVQIPCGLPSGHANAPGAGQQKLVHHLVLEAFRGRRPLKHEGAHCNGQHHDNRLSNLAWKTVKENSDDAFRHGARKIGPRGFVRTYA